MAEAAFRPPLDDVVETGVTGSPVEDRHPIFVDTTGQRARVVRRVSYAVTGVCAIYTVTLGLSLAGATSIAPSALLPLPGIPAGPILTIADDKPEPRSASAAKSQNTPLARRPGAQGGGKGFSTVVGATGGELTQSAGGGGQSGTGTPVSSGGSAAPGSQPATQNPPASGGGSNPATNPGSGPGASPSAPPVGPADPPPSDPTDPPTDPSDPPTDPSDPSDPPSDPSDPPSDPSDPPTDPTDPPSDPSDPPTDPTDPPSDPVDPPSDDPTDPPIDPVGDIVDLLTGTLGGLG